jgi:hypothetical protein
MYVTKFKVYATLGNPVIRRLALIRGKEGRIGVVGDQQQQCEQSINAALAMLGGL